MSDFATELPFDPNDVEEGHSKGFVLADGLSLFAVKKDGQLFIYKNRCPHLGIELEWQEDSFLDSEGALIQCATHGALFIIDSGECVAGPCLGQSLVPVAYYCRDGLIFIDPA